jgi:hypothetical protein
MVLQDLCHDNHVNGMEIFYDPELHLLVTVVEYCKYGSLAKLIESQEKQHSKFTETDLTKIFI